jgi:hypothetical protein
MADRKFLRRQFGVRLPHPPGAQQSSPFALSEREFTDITTAMQELGDYGARIREQLRSFVKASLQHNLHPADIQ